MKSLRPDHPIFKSGWIVGQTFSGGTPKRKAASPDPEPSKAPDAEQDQSQDEALHKLLESNIEELLRLKK